ncbi:MAG: hypothetical protein ABJN61_11675 [Flavobacteriaceae bacterium]|uniref:hypothetical protein n=1 Tax=Nonlabens ulvanivorans TaxID=906888 RepID=UPI0032993EF8
MKELSQRKFFVKREFRITESKLYYNYSKFGNSTEVDIPFENIEGSKTSHRVSHNIILAVSAVFYLIAVAVYYSYSNGGNGERFAWLFWGVIATVVLGSYFLTRDSFWRIRLSNNSQIYLHKNIPNLSVTTKFIEEIIDARNTYLIEQYSFVDKNLDYDKQLNNLRWLRSIDVINKEEFEIKYAQLRNSINPNQSGIGYSN